MANFIPQKTVPSKSDKWYIRTNKGGYSQCIAGKPEYFSGSVLSNCVGYAWGRMAYLENDKKCDIGVPPSRIKKGMHNPTSAYAWMQYTGGRKTGDRARLGAVAVWKHATKKDYGHVAVVEEVYSDGSWLSSESSYNGTTFQNKKYNKNSARNGFKFQGFIYCKVDYEKPQPTGLKVGDKVKIVAKGNARKDGKGKTCGGVGWIRYVLDIYNGQPYPYRVGNSLGVTTGYYTESALQKV